MLRGGSTMFEGKKLGFGLMRLPLTDANDKGSIEKDRTVSGF